MGAEGESERELEELAVAVNEQAALKTVAALEPGCVGVFQYFTVNDFVAELPEQNAGPPDTLFHQLGILH